MIFLLIEQLSNGQLYAIMSGIWGVVGPAESLFEVIRRLVIELPAQGHEVIPFLKGLFIGGLDAVYFVFAPDLQTFISVHTLYCYSLTLFAGLLMNSIIIRWYDANKYPNDIVQGDGHQKHDFSV